MRRLSARGHDGQPENAVRELQLIRLRMPEPTGSRDLGRLDVISAGAITHGMLFALLRVPGLSGTHEKRRPIAFRQRTPRHRSTTLSWRLMMQPTVQSFHAPNGVIASALAS